MPGFENRRLRILDSWCEWRCWIIIQLFLYICRHTIPYICMCACTHTVVASSYDSVRAVDFSTGRIEIYFCFDVVYFLNTSNNRDGQCFPTGFPVALCMIRKTQYYCCGRRNYSAESSSSPPPVCPSIVREDANAWPVSKSLRVSPPPSHITPSAPLLPRVYCR